MTAPWRKFYNPKAAALTRLVPTPLPALLDEAATAFPERAGVTLGGESLTYAQVHERVGRLAAGLAGLGIGIGDRVGYMGPPHPVFTLNCFALWHLGAVQVGMNPLYSEQKLACQLADADLSAIVTLDEPALLAKALQVAGRASSPTPVIAASAHACDPSARSRLPGDAPGPLVGMDRLLREGGTVARASVDPSATAALQYTGGTTGTPKAAMLTHANLWANAHQMTSWFPELESGREILLAAAPVTHVAGLGPVQNFMIRIAGELVWLPRFQPQEALRLIRKHEVSVVMAPPTMFVALLEASAGTRFDWSQVRSAQAGASPVPLELKRRFHQATGLWITTLYGMTETSPASIYSTPRPDQAGATGIPLPLTEVEIRSCADPSKRVPPGEPGEICIRGPQVMAGYWNRPDETERAFVDGFFRSGDIGTMTEEGVITVLDRLKDVIIASGYNIYPVDVENAIAEHPLVREAAVIGVPDAYRGETVKAIVSLRDGGSLTLAELQAFLASRLSPMEMPKQLEIVDDIPKSENLKISKVALRQREADRAAASS